MADAEPKLVRPTLVGEVAERCERIAKKLGIPATDVARIATSKGLDRMEKEEFNESQAQPAA
jgi:hypothetical protein